MATKSKKQQRDASNSSEQSTVTSSERPTSPLSPQIRTRLQEKHDLQNLNDRLAKYIERVRVLELENGRLAQQVNSSQEVLSREVVTTKSVYEKEIKDARELLDDTARDKAKVIIENNSLKAELDEVSDKLNSKEKELAAADKKVLKLEGELSDAKNRHNQSVVDNKRIEEELKKANAEAKKLKEQLGVIKSQLENETLGRIDSENRIQSLREEIQFKQTVYEKELEESRYIQESEISEALQQDIEDRYQQELAAKLVDLREENQAQWRLNNEDLESRYRTKCNIIEGDLKKKEDELKTKSAELKALRSKYESTSMQLNEAKATVTNQASRIGDLEVTIDQERNLTELALQKKLEEISKLKEEMKQYAADYTDLLNIKVALDAEINVYRTLLESEESRLTPGQSSVASPRRFVTPRHSSRVTKRKREVLVEEEILDDIEVHSDTKGDVEICDHDVAGKFVKLYNKSEKEVSLSGWTLTHDAGSERTVHRFHRSVIMKPNTYVTVWSSDTNTTHNPPADIVMKTNKWFSGDEISTALTDSNGIEMAVRSSKKQYRTSYSGQRRSKIYRPEENGTETPQEKCSLM